MGNQLSYWEELHYRQIYDYVIIGAGLVGISAALTLKQNDCEATVLILEQGIVSQGASTKNAGFSCFGSIGELEDDLECQSFENVLETVKMRWKGLKKLKSSIPESEMDYIQAGGWEVFRDKTSFDRAESEIQKWNKALGPIIGDCVFEVQNNPLPGLYSKAIYNKYEGQLNPKKAIHYLHNNARLSGIEILQGIEILSWHNEEDLVEIFSSDNGNFYTKNLLLATNGYTQKIFSSLDVKPARNQVIITQELDNLDWQGNFHLDKGYIYFRSVGNRILLGGARFLSDLENTMEYGTTDVIISYLKELLTHQIINDSEVEIETEWSGILGVGSHKRPIIKKIEEHVYCAVRLGGMGVAIGLHTGETLARLVQKQ